MHWAIFCKVIDNYGDVGVAWRLCADLANRGERVHLLIDDPAPLAWMAPGGHPGVEVIPWHTQGSAAAAAITGAEVLMECFGCDIAPALEVSRGHPASKTGLNAIWINLEYLSFEPQASRNHGLESPVQGTSARLRKFFYYPGPQVGAGGLVREPGLLERMQSFDHAAFLRSVGVEPDPGEMRISLFCYEPPALLPWLQALAARGRRTRLLVTPGRARAALDAAIQSLDRLQTAWNAHGQLSFSYLPWLPQAQFDSLLCACDFNAVRGEDSLARALLAGKPFVWHIYPQADGAHAAKLDAFLDWLQAPASLRGFMRAWNGLSGPGASTLAPPTSPAPDLAAMDLAAWSACTEAAQARLLAQDDLCTRLTAFVRSKIPL